MNILRIISRAFVVLTIFLALYDLTYQWVVKAQMKIRNVEELWIDISGKEGFEAGEKSLQSLLGQRWSDNLLHAPTPVLAGAAALFFYLLYRALMFVTGKDKSQRI